MRQVRITGRVAPISRDEVAGYFATLPPAVQTMLRACRQSEVIADRAALDRLYAAALESSDESLPDHWGGYLVETETIEFFQARENWLQDRLRYSRRKQGWLIERLVP